jgi:two-component system, cell cycle response regulator
MSGTQKRLLAMQSDDITMAVLEELLDGRNVAIRMVAAHGQVIQAALEWIPDAILVSGQIDDDALFALCRCLRDQASLCELPLLVLLPRSDREMRLAVLRCGADDCMCRPYDMIELGLKLGNMLRVPRFRRTVAERNLFTTVSEHVEHGIVLIDAQLRINYVNQAARSDYGLSTDSSLTWLEQLAGRFTICNEEDWLRAMHKSVDTDALMMFEGRVGQGGTPEGLRWYKCILYKLGDDPEERVVVALVDVTQQLEMQDVLLGVKRLISHKLITPLNGLVGPLDILAEEDVDADERKLLVDTARESASRLVDAVSGMEDFFSFPESNEASVPAKVADLPDILKQYTSDMLLNNMSYTCNAPGDILLPIDKEHLGAVITELFENSVKFHPRHRPSMRVNVSLRDGNVYLNIIDDGGHIPSAALRYLHVPFYQAGIGLAGEVQGHGIGLAQISRIIMSVGGRIRFTNRDDGSGICTTIFLPASLTKDSKKSANADILASSNLIR